MNTMETTTHVAAPKLQPCPFCGAEPGGVDGDDIARSVGCHCGANGPVRQFDAEAIEHWNRRTTRSEWSHALVYAAQHQLDVLQDILTLQDDSAIESLARHAHADLSAAIGRARRAQEGGQG